MDKYRIKHRWKSVGDGIKRCRRCKLAYLEAVGWSLWGKNKLINHIRIQTGSSVGYYKCYYSDTKMANLWDDTKEIEYFYVKDDDYLGKQINCTEGIIADILL